MKKLAVILLVLALCCGCAAAEDTELSAFLGQPFSALKAAVPECEVDGDCLYSEDDSLYASQSETSDITDFICLSGKGYSLFGLTTGMKPEEIMAAVSAAGLIIEEDSIEAEGLLFAMSEDDALFVSVEFENGVSTIVGAEIDLEAALYEDSED